MTDYLSKVREFHEAFRRPDQAPTPTRPTLYPEDSEEANKRLHALRLALIVEEADELREALEDEDIVEVADALSDLAYVVVGAAISFGINLDEAFDEVHRSNMTKLDENGKAIFREDGKVMKSKFYERPQLAKIITRQINPLIIPGDEG